MNDCGSSTKTRVSAFLRPPVRRARRALFVVAALAAVALAGLGAHAVLGTHGSSTRAFDLEALGKPQAQAPSLHTPGLTATVSRQGYTATAGDTAVSVFAVGAGAGTGAWKRYAHGVTRPTSYGHETITLAPNAVEQLSTVVDRQGTRTWRWQLNTINLNPSLRSDGSVWFASGKTVGSKHILPVAIFDRSGKNVTPAGLRWSLRRVGTGWLLELKLNDSKLPLPYVIDPGLTGVSATATSLAAGAKPTGRSGSRPAPAPAPSPPPARSPSTTEPGPVVRSRPIRLCSCLLLPASSRPARQQRSTPPEA